MRGQFQVDAVISSLDYLVHLELVCQQPCESQKNFSLFLLDAFHQLLEVLFLTSSGVLDHAYYKINIHQQVYKAEN
jgi:hypothetical protein